MRGAFNDKELEPVEQPHYTDVTLGPATLIGIILILLLVGAAVFGLGYTMGHRGSQDSSAEMKPAPDSQSSTQPNCVQAKPSASSQADVASALEGDSDTLASQGSSDANSAAMPQNADPAAAAGSSISQNQVRPALAPAANPAQLATGMGGGINASQSVAPAGTVMVQIAAVSHPEDADVLVNALRKRGYAVTARRDTDSLIHVRIGPFTSRAEANKWGQKLMSDGYNAIVQP
jgi:cell division septation protein DedD